MEDGDDTRSFGRDLEVKEGGMLWDGVWKIEMLLAESRSMCNTLVLLG